MNEGRVCTGMTRPRMKRGGGGGWSRENEKGVGWRRGAFRREDCGAC